MTRFIALSGLLVSLASTLIAEDTLLYIQPEDGAQIIARADSTEAAIAKGTEVLDPDAAAKGWKWTEYTMTTEGYVPTESVSKNFEIESGTLVRNESNSRGIVLTTAQAKDKFEILTSGPQWTGVRFTKPIPVYFKKNSSGSKPFTPATEIHSQKPANRITVNRAPKFDPNLGVGATNPNALRPENVQWKAADSSVQPLKPKTTAPVETVPEKPQAPSAIVVAAEQAAPRETPLAPSPAIDTPTRTLSGELVREISNQGPRYPLRLKDDEGNRMAYVDMSDIFISDLRPYLNQQVFVSGEVRAVVPGSKELVIHARILQLIE